MTESQTLTLIIATINFVSIAYNYWALKSIQHSVECVIDIFKKNTLNKQQQTLEQSDVDIQSDLGRRLLEIQRGRYARLRTKG
jgi:hypothetical protein